jgi:hypothetical protein
MMLFVYLSAKAHLNSIFGQIFFCKEFSTPFIKDTKMGYCLTTMEIALKLLTEEKDLIKIERDDTDAYENKRNSIKNVVR